MSANKRSQTITILLGPTHKNLDSARVEEPLVVRLSESLSRKGCLVETFDTAPRALAFNAWIVFVLGNITEDEIVDAAESLASKVGASRVVLLYEKSMVRPTTLLNLETLGYDRFDLEDVASRLLKKTNPKLHELNQMTEKAQRWESVRDQLKSDDLKQAKWLVALVTVLLLLVSSVTLLTQTRGVTSSSPASPSVTSASVSNGDGRLAGVENLKEIEAEGITTASTHNRPATEILSNSPLKGATGVAGNSMYGGLGGGDRSTGVGTATTAISEPATDASLTTKGTVAGNSSSTMSVAESSAQPMAVTCEVYIPKGSSLSRSIDCNDQGVLRVKGWYGPWHNEIKLLAVSAGTEGALYYEQRPGQDAPQTLALVPGIIPMDTKTADYGVAKIVLTFSGEGEHIHLYSSSDAQDGESATLSFGSN